MENFAYLHLAVDYEDPAPEPTVRSLKELGLTLPNSTWVGVASLMIAISIVATTHQAMALIVRGNTGPAVTEVQSALRGQGYDIGVDGVFGGQTESALRNFQRSKGLAADGVVGSATASALGVSYNGGGSGGGSNTGTVTITAGSGVNIRSGPGTNYAIVGGLGNGARVSTFGSSNGWLRVNGGWISSAFTNGGSGGGSGGGSNTGTVTITAGSGVNIRSGPGTNYAIVGGLGNGARVSTFGSSNGWLRVNGGWISSAFTNGGSGGGSGGGTPTGVVTVVPAIGVNIRSGPGTNYAIVGGLSGGARVSTFGSSGGWYRVSGGWVSGSNVQ